MLSIFAEFGHVARPCVSVKIAPRSMLLSRGPVGIASIRAARMARNLGSWAGEFESTRGASLGARLALGDKLSKVWR